MTIYLAVFFCVFIVSSLVELYKTDAKARHGKVNHLIAIGIALSVSMIMATILFYSFSMVREGATRWSIVYYGLVIYFLQKELGMEVMKPMLKKIGERV